MRPSQEPVVKTPLFKARENGYRVCRIPTLLAAGGEALIACVEARRGAGGDYDPNDILIRRSLDGGKTWTEARQLVRNSDYGPGPISNLSLFLDRQTGSVHALFCHDYSRVFHMRSEDRGASFSQPSEITKALEGYREEYPWQVIATGPGHGLQLRSGRMIAPLWMSDGSGGEMGSGKRGHRPSAVGLVYSDDHGASWRRGGIVVKNGGFVVNPSETVAEELSDGSVLFNIRSESDAQRRLISISPNGVDGWSEPHFDNSLLEPVCMGSILRYSWPEDGGSRLLFANPDNLERTMTTCWGGTVRRPNCDRKRLSVQMSRDEGRSWPVKRVIEEGPSGYSDMASLGNGTILCLYESGVVDGMFDDKCVTLASFSLEWLSGETDFADATEKTELAI